MSLQVIAEIDGVHTLPSQLPPASAAACKAISSDCTIQSSCLEKQNQNSMQISVAFENMLLTLLYLSDTHELHGKVSVNCDIVWSRENVSCLFRVTQDCPCCKAQVSIPTLITVMHSSQQMDIISSIIGIITTNDQYACITTSIMCSRWQQRTRSPERTQKDGST